MSNSKLHPAKKSSLEIIRKDAVGGCKVRQSNEQLQVLDQDRLLPTLAQKENIEKIGFLIIGMLSIKMCMVREVSSRAAYVILGLNSHYVVKNYSISY